MNHTTTHPHLIHEAEIKSITLDDPWKWLKLGWHDMLQTPIYSLSYGMIFVVFGYLMAWGVTDSILFLMILPLTTGFFLLAPILAIGLYSISRAIEHAEKVEIQHIKTAWSSNSVHISAMGLVLMFIMLFWMLAANVIFLLFFNQPTPSWENFIPVVFLSGESTMFLLVGIICGGVFAFFTFCISVISIPMLMDQDVDFMTAIQTSISAFKKNPWPLLLWAYLIVMYVGIGIISFFIGLLVTMPLIGHASWHAYRDLIENKPN